MLGRKSLPMSQSISHTALAAHAQKAKPSRTKSIGNRGWRPPANSVPGSDVRELKDAKAPDTAVEMALLTYYLTELAPIAEKVNCQLV